MGADPVLVLQLHRMGDLILTFPLLLHLQRLHPDCPLWVVADPRFFRELMPLAPKVVFFTPEHCDALACRSYTAAINLSSAPVAAACMGRLKAPCKLGPVADADGLHIRGFWQLYRAALTQNNRNNAFHWADLHQLDLTPGPDLSREGHARPAPAGTRRVGLVLGASEEAKRPDAAFWARLAVRLAANGAPPVFLGGPAEAELGAEVARRSGLHDANCCGKLSLGRLAALMRTLDLCITPDTGPMHLADFLGVPVLNLSMGPVHARETGPSAPGQWVLRADMSCVGCWQCNRAHLYCKRAFAPLPVAQTALRLLEHSAATPADAAPAASAGLALYRTGRDALGLHTLTRSPSAPPSACRPLLEDLWQAVFLYLYNPRQEALLQERLARLAAVHPRLVRNIAEHLSRLCAVCAARLRQGSRLPENFWRTQPGILRLFTGHLHMFLQNTGFDREGWNVALTRLGALASLFAAAA
ncbi:glycosyltransferase family 9 protein [uncultured Desulfovibrio sp.]|uniref:glycosyltransferase family 9 protein n=1 Tax=uncultured Desulfovibrio sp. TaxID=167968 RepID=UPI002617A64F|nr:glycosyltransferase family 9 protein [uncultured Desulfovibrio sp.]